MPLCNSTSHCPCRSQGWSLLGPLERCQLQSEKCHLWNPSARLGTLRSNRKMRISDKEGSRLQPFNLLVLRPLPANWCPASEPGKHETKDINVDGRLLFDVLSVAEREHKLSCLDVRRGMRCPSGGLSPCLPKTSKNKRWFKQLLLFSRWLRRGHHTGNLAKDTVSCLSAPTLWWPIWAGWTVGLCFGCCIQSYLLQSATQGAVCMLLLGWPGCCLGCMYSVRQSELDFIKVLCGVQCQNYDFIRGLRYVRLYRFTNEASGLLSVCLMFVAMFVLCWALTLKELRMSTAEGWMGRI